MTQGTVGRRERIGRVLQSFCVPKFDAAEYGPEIAEVLALAGGGLRRMPLAPRGCPSDKARDRLDRLDRARLFAGRKIVSTEFAEAARSGLYLYLGRLEDSHGISQTLPSTTGSYWHGIMHRQEPDFGNAAYWFRRVGQHEIFPSLRGVAVEAAPDRFGGAQKWNPFNFIDACAQVHRRPEARLESVLEQIQLAEWQLLFDFSARRAVEAQP